MSYVEHLGEIRGNNVPVVLSPDLTQIKDVLGNIDSLRPHYRNRSLKRASAQKIVDKKYRDLTGAVDRWVATGQTESTRG